MDRLKQYKYFALLGLLIVVFIIYLYVSSLNRSLPTNQENNWNNEEEVFDQEEAVEPKEEEILEDILVDVKGAVAKPGVYKAQSGERAIDIIEKAGGLKEDAEDNAINFAMRVTDEMVLYIPSQGENLENAEASIVTAQQGGDSEKINLNKADQTELETLPGIGATKAQAIIEYRETNGPFKVIEDIMSISGFGEKTFEKLKENITVK